MDLEFHQLDLRYEDLRLHRPDCENRLLASLSEQGQQMPVVVVRGEQEGKYLVIDGFKRLRCLRRLRRDTVCATLLDLEPAEALLLESSQRSSDKPSAIEQAWLLVMLRSQGLSQQELARRMDKSVSWVSRHLGMASDLPTPVQEHVRRGTIPATAAMRSLLPIARFDREGCLLLTEAIASAELNSREVEKVCAAFLESSPEVRERLLKDPRLFLRARACKSTPTPQPAHLEMLQALEKMARMTRRLCECVTQNESTPTELAELHLASAEVRAQLDTFEKEIHCAGREESQRDPDPCREEDLEPANRQDTEDLAQHREKSDRLAEPPAPADRTAGEGGVLPRRDSGASHDLPGQSREGPRRDYQDGREVFLPEADRLLPSSRDRDEAQAAGGPIPLRARGGDAARHLRAPN